jgi:hypothetical protein
MDFERITLFWLVVFLAFNGLLAFIPAFIAREKGRSFGAFWALGFFTTIVVGLIAVLAMPSVEKQLRTVRTDASGNVLADETEMPETIKCPFCAEMVKPEASKCRYCQSDISKHVQAIKSQVNENKMTYNREEIARLQEHKLQIAERRKNRLKRLKSPAGIAIVSIVLLALVGASTVLALNLRAVVLEQEASNDLLQKQISVVTEEIGPCGAIRVSPSGADLSNMDKINISYSDENIFIQMGDLDSFYCVSKRLEQAGIPFSGDFPITIYKSDIKL